MIAMMLSLVLAGPHAHHDVALVDDRVTIDTHWSTGTIAGGEHAVALAVPLPADAELVGAAPVRDAEDRIVALRFDGSEPPHLQTRVPFASAQRALPIPVLDGGGVQRVSLDDALAFHPDPALEMVTHLGHHVSTAIDHDERRAIDRQLREAPIGSYYATTSVIAREHGLVGELELRADMRHRSAIAVAVLFVVVCGVGVIAYRRSQRGAEAERAEQLLAAEFDGLERDGA
jgi:hypothetical protein